MATRTNIHFKYGMGIVATVYRHYDGDEQTVKKDLETFFKDVESETKDTRFNDPSYLAAKFVVWQADQYSNGGKLNFLGVGIMNEEGGDIEFRHFVDCGNFDENGHPRIISERV